MAYLAKCKVTFRKGVGLKNFKFCATENANLLVNATLLACLVLFRHLDLVTLATPPELSGLCWKRIRKKGQKE